MIHLLLNNFLIKTGWIPVSIWLLMCIVALGILVEFLILSDIAEVITKWGSWLISELKLFYTTPKDYIYLLAIPATKKVHIVPYKNDLQKIADKLITQIQKKMPELKVNFVGSAKLKVLGERDIDLFVEAKASEFETFIPQLVALFGEPEKIRKMFAEWVFKVDDINVEITLVDPWFKGYIRSMKVFRALEKNKFLLKEYVEFKKKLQNSSVRKYIHHRMGFFNHVLEKSL